MFDFLMLVVGLAILIGGGDLLVRGAVGLANRLGVAPVIVGLTVVAFGTSTPELVVNLSAAWRGDSAIGFGNVVGSNIANIGFLLGVVALFYPLTIHRGIVIREIPMMLLASAAATVLGLNSLTDGGVDQFTRGNGLMLLLLFGVFLYYTLLDALNQRKEDLLEEVDTSQHLDSVSRITISILGGLLILVIGGELTVRGAVGLAQSLGIDDVIVGLTLVAVGTSLPELATSLIAARRGQSDMAVGNIVGSNIFNLLFVWGLTVSISPTELPPGGGIDLLVMAAFSLALLPMVLKEHRLPRWGAALLLIGYVIYIGSLIARAL